MGSPKFYDTGTATCGLQKSSLQITLWAFYTAALNKFAQSASVNGAIVCMINGQGLKDFHQTSL